MKRMERLSPERKEGAVITEEEVAIERKLSVWLRKEQLQLLPVKRLRYRRTRSACMETDRKH